ncbi:MAG: hypothetical protein ABI818_15925 [Acidobacteriota bacterium]
MLTLLETARLHLAPIQRDDAQAVQAIFPQWEVVRYLASTVPWPYLGNTRTRALGWRSAPGR